MGDRLVNRIWKVTAWRETVPSTPTDYSSRRLKPGEQLEITDLRVKFKIERAFTKHPNSCDIYIYNLASETRGDLETKPLTVQIDAGYDGVARLLYIGDLRFGMTEQDGGNNITLLQLGDTDRKITYARMNRSYKEGTTYKQVLVEAARSMGLQLPANVLADPVLSRQFVAGTVGHGPAREMLTRLLAPFGYHWSVQNGELRILKDNEVVRSAALPINKSKGMIGSPKYGSPPKSGKPPHMTVKMLLYPELVPGDVVELTSKVKNGLFRLERVTHSGDSHSASDWTTEVELKPY